MKPAADWGLSPAQALALEALIAHGTAKKAAQALGLSNRTVEAHAAEVRRRADCSHLITIAAAWALHRADRK